tara:strand:- start:88 stop:471 length:384 start_codon:yes stop_codon:yes gene_type:complete
VIQPYIRGETYVNKEMIKPMVQGIVIGAIVMVIVMFWTGWAVTSGAAAANSEEMAKEAVVENLGPICVEQYLQDPNKLERFAELKKKSSYQRDDYVNEIGWATMPGAESPVRGVADACAKRIMELAG